MYVCMHFTFYLLTRYLGRNPYGLHLIYSVRCPRPFQYGLRAGLYCPQTVERHSGVLTSYHDIDNDGGQEGCEELRLNSTDDIDWHTCLQDLVEIVCVAKSSPYNESHAARISTETAVKMCFPTRWPCEVEPGEPHFKTVLPNNRVSFRVVFSKDMLHNIHKLLGW